MQTTAPETVSAPNRRSISMLRSVGARLFLSVLGGTLVGLACTSYLSYQELSKRAQSELIASLSVKAENLEGSFNTFENSAQLVASAIKTLYNGGEKREQVYVDLIRRALETTPLSTGLGFGQPPNNRLLIPSRQRAYPYALRKDGRIIAKGGETEADAYEEQYFKEPIRTGKALWLEPTSYLETTLNPPKKLVTTSYTFPFYSDPSPGNNAASTPAPPKRQLLGVFSQDLELGFLSEELAEPVMREAGYFVLVSAKGSLIAYPPDPQKALDLTPFPNLDNYGQMWAQLQAQIKTGKTSGILPWRNTKGQREFWAYHHIANNDWVLLASVPEAIVYRPVLQFTLQGAIGATLGASFVLALVVFLFVRNLNRRIQPIMDECNRLAETSAKTEELMSREDELGRLTISFYSLLGQVTANEKRLRKEMNRANQALDALKKAQTQLIQTEKMSSLGQMVAGIAHEINNPINFIYGNLSHASGYVQELLELVELYEQKVPEGDPDVDALRDDIELDFLKEDLQKVLSSMSIGAERIRAIVLSLRNFSRLDEAEVKRVDIHEGIDSTLLILQSRLKESSNHKGIEVVRNYGELPKIECYPGQLNQVFMNILSNAIDVLDEQQQKNADAAPPTITITTALSDDNSTASISINDNGPGVPEKHLAKLFDPFFTTKPAGKGTGLGLSISYQIIKDKHNGSLKCLSDANTGATFVIEIPVYQPNVPS